MTNTWTASYLYKGAVTDNLSEFVRIGGQPIAHTSSGSTLPQGGHAVASPSDLTSLIPVPNKLEAFVTQPDGKGVPNERAGSIFVRVGGEPVLLDSDKFNTCGSSKGFGNSSVSAGGQAFVRCSE